MSLFKEHETKEKSDGFSTSTMCKPYVTGNGPTYLKSGEPSRYRSFDIDDWVDAKLVRSTSEKVQ